MNTNKKTPKLRFKGFTDDWEQRKLTSFTQRVKGNDGRMDLPTLTISASEGWLNQKDRFSANIAGSEQKNYTLLRQGELSYNHGNSKLAKYGVVYALKDYKEALVPRVYHSFRVDESYDALFVEYYFSTKRPDRELGKLVSSGARMDGLLNIGYDEFTNISISVPTFSEQKQIVALLKVCDKYITLHQRKLEKLKLNKSALLQKLFPQTGCTIPDVRFKGFTDAWEQRKLDELTIFIGDGLHGTPKYDENGSYYFINGNNLVDNKVSVTEETKKVAFEALGNDDRRLDSTAILMSINGTIGTLARYNNENIMLGKSVAYITPKNINRDFLFYQLQGNVIQSYFYKNLTGTTIKNLGLGTIKNTIVMSTLSEEESTIGRFFYKLDQYITLHQRKLDCLISIKKGLLQQLFV